jgi:hypothetical protein
VWIWHCPGLYCLRKLCKSDRTWRAKIGWDEHGKPLWWVYLSKKLENKVNNNNDDGHADLELIGRWRTFSKSLSKMVYRPNDHGQVRALNFDISKTKLCTHRRSRGMTMMKEVELCMYVGKRKNNTYFEPILRKLIRHELQNGNYPVMLFATHPVRRTEQFVIQSSHENFIVNYIRDFRPQNWTFIDDARTHSNSRGYTCRRIELTLIFWTFPATTVTWIPVSVSWSDRVISC